MHRRMTLRPILILLLVLTSSSMLPVVTLAQEATPGTSPVSAR